MGNRVQNSITAFKFHDSQYIMSIFPDEYRSLRLKLNHDPMDLVDILEESNEVINEFDKYTVSGVMEEHEI